MGPYVCLGTPYVPPIYRYSSYIGLHNLASLNNHALLNPYKGPYVRVVR
jgi:hypothetical protein